ncbi:hypothetical protein CDD80_6088 [Ophiocordyceps camponoti-rufipedis]|uniref:Glucose-methanol-choline oxidoreductase N-terminal domain-containing protein n=1 Tax=Ophiocordyceps camponoti-rufipedis TaxID=2004952 RepID=A0A2C5XT80_9HYPO|nr:hypothetical protein CDD80_6088 [Ophiocordyceps camponoti-rufipedis]
MATPSSLLSPIVLTILLLLAVAASAVELSGYDYIVVGSGAGGGPLAARLAMAGRRTLLIEAGTDQGNNLNTTVPAFSARSNEDSDLSWDFFVRHYGDDELQARDPKTSYRTADGQRYTGLKPPPGAEMLGVLYPRAAALGGCSVHNALVSVTPHRSDWDDIARLTGDSSWTSDRMHVYFRRVNREQRPPLSPPISPTDGAGWLSIERAPLGILATDPLSASVLLGGAFAMGNRTGAANTVANLLAGDANEDSPRRDREGGYFQTPLAAHEGKRVSARDFVVAVRDAKKADGSRRFPLDVRTNCQVTRVIFNKEQPPRATGVEFLDGAHLYRASPRSSGSSGEPGSATASREVILSAGAFNTPQLLKLSGVGPAAELARFNISLVHDAPGVGSNLQDHYEVAVQSRAPTNFTLLRGCTFSDDAAHDPCLSRWESPNRFSIAGPRGVYSSSGVLSSMLVRTAAATEYDIFIFGGPVDFRGYYPGFSRDLVATRDLWSWIVLKAHPLNSAGTVTLRSADPLDVPDVIFNSFGDDEDGSTDLRAVREGISVARDAFRRQLVRMKEVVPGEKAKSEEALDGYIRDNVFGHHAASTCAIGADDDPMAVLDSKFRVRGVKGLRVVDASVFPVIPGSFPALAIYMVAEKAADVILAGK